MKVTGFTKRSLAERDEVSYLFSGSLSNVTGSGVFGFSGDSGSQGFLFKEGKIYDFENRYFSSYQSGEIFSISGNISGSKYNYYFEEEPIVFVGNSSIGKINSFYSDVTGCEINADVKIKSKTFAYTLAFPSTYKAGDEITGYLSGNDSSYSFKIFSGEVTSPDYWTLTGFDTGDVNYSNIKLINTGETSGINNLEHQLRLTLYTNLGNLEKDVSFKSTSSDPEAGTIFSLEDGGESGSYFKYTGEFNNVITGDSSLSYQIFAEEIEFTGDKPIKISLDDIDTSGDINGYSVTGIQLQGKYKNGLYTGLPTITLSSNGAKDVQATVTALTGEYMCADLYTGGPSSSPLWDLNVKFHTITGIQIDTSGAYENPNSISISLSGGLYTGASNVFGYWYDGPQSESNSNANCTGTQGYWYSSGNYNDIINSHIKTHASGLIPLTTTGNVFSRTLKNTWNLLTGESPTGTGDASLESFSNEEPWSGYISTGSFSGLTITQSNNTSGDSYYNSGTTSKNNIRIEVWNKGEYKPITDTGAKIITKDNFYTNNYNPTTVNSGGTSQWPELKNLITGTLEAGGTGEITFTYSFIQSGTRRDNFYTEFKTLEDAGNSVTLSQFTGEVVSAFSEWKGLFESVYTGLTLNFVNNGMETGNIIWSDRSTTPYQLPHTGDSKIGDIRIGKVLLDNTEAISSIIEYNSGCLLGQSGNVGGDIIINSYNKNYRLDSDTSSTGNSYSIKYLFCQQIGKILGVHQNDHGDSILYNPQDGTSSLYTSWSFSDYFSNGLSGSRPDQDAVRYSYGSKNHYDFEQSKTKTNPSQDLYSVTLNISGSGSQNISQIITGGVA